jgi:hypothetical protein
VNAPVFQFTGQSWDKLAARCSCPEDVQENNEIFERCRASLPNDVGNADKEYFVKLFTGQGKEDQIKSEQL